MIAKAVLAVALVIAPADDISFVQYPQVRQVRCNHASGTAFQTTKGWVSVAHVTSLYDCKIDGRPITATEQNRGQDFSRIVTDVARWLPLPISCEGFAAGRYYYSTGYALGRPYQTNVRIMATGYVGPGGMQVLVSDHTVIPGMSGGPIMDERGAVVGTVNAFNPELGLSFSRSLRDTTLCK